MQQTGSRVQQGEHEHWVLYVKKLTERHFCQPDEAAVKQLQIYFTGKELGLVFINKTF